jgi:hypothetical protein
MPRHYLPSLLDSKAVSPMDRDLTDIFIKCTLMETHLDRKNEQEYFTETTALEMGPGALILWHRLIAYAPNQKLVAKLTLSAALVVASQCRKPGTSVLWAFTLNRMFQNQNQPVTLADLALAFPIGFPTEEAESEVWEAQKGNNWGEKVDNMLDHPGLLAQEVVDADKKEWCQWLK